MVKVIHKGLLKPEDPIFREEYKFSLLQPKNVNEDYKKRELIKAYLTILLNELKGKK